MEVDADDDEEALEIVEGERRDDFLGRGTSYDGRRTTASSFDSPSSHSKESESLPSRVLPS